MASEALHYGVLVFNGLSALVAAASAPRRDRLVPGLIGVGVALAVLGDVLCRIFDAGGARTDISVADPAWLSSYVLLCVAMATVLTRSGDRRDRWWLTLDGLTVTAVSLLVVWTLTIGHVLRRESAPLPVQMVWVSFPLLQAVLLALVLLTLIGSRSRQMIGSGFAAGMGLWLVTNIAYLHAPSATGLSVASATWLAAVVLMARSAWLWRGTLPSDAPDAPDAPTRVGWLPPVMIGVLPLLVPPAVELLSELLDHQHHPRRLAVGSTVLIVLAFVRTARLMHGEQLVLRQLERARDRALDASRAKSMFVATMSHELRTPLTTMLACAEMLEDTPLTDHQSNLVMRMRRSGGLLQSLVEDVLDFSRIESGRVELAAVPFDLHALAAELSEAYVARATTAGLGFELEIAHDVPHAVVGDPSRMMQVVDNLLDNAVKFTDRGSVRLQVRVTGRGAGPERPTSEDHGHDHGEPDVVIEVVVADTGIGVEPERLESVFGAFEQIDGPPRRHGGSGLGLAISRQLVTLMGGCMALRSELGQGSEFVVTFPLALDHAGEVATPDVAPPEPRRTVEVVGAR